jgi:uncharacterized protein
MEIVSMTGTFTGTAKHIHMVVSFRDGSTAGGHLVSGTIFTTLEVVLGTIEDVSFTREYDDKTGYSELVVASRPTAASAVSSTTATASSAAADSDHPCDARSR